MIQGEASEDEIDSLEEASALRDIAHMPARVKCADAERGAERAEVRAPRAVPESVRYFTAFWIVELAKARGTTGVLS